jgi:hypothetical protein
MMPGVLWPVPAELRIITTDYGGSTDYEAFHQGIDIGIPEGTPLRSPISGIAFIDHTDTSGNILWIIDTTGASNLAIRCCHLSEYTVVNGQQVAMGDVVALSGMSGDWVTGPHLHLEVWENGTPAVPGPYCNNEMVVQLLWRNGNDYNRIDPMEVLEDIEIPIPETTVVVVNEKRIVGMPRIEYTVKPVVVGGHEDVKNVERPVEIAGDAGGNEAETFLPITVREELPEKTTGIGGLGLIGSISVALAFGVGIVLAAFRKRKKV